MYWTHLPESKYTQMPCTHITHAYSWSSVSEQKGRNNRHLCLYRNVCVFFFHSCFMARFCTNPIETHSLNVRMACQQNIKCVCKCTQQSLACVEYFCYAPFAFVVVCIRCFGIHLFICVFMLSFYWCYLFLYVTFSFSSLIIQHKHTHFNLYWKLSSITQSIFPAFSGYNQTARLFSKRVWVCLCISLFNDF